MGPAIATAEYAPIQTNVESGYEALEDKLLELPNSNELTSNPAQSRSPVEMILLQYRDSGQWKELENLGIQETSIHVLTSDEKWFDGGKEKTLNTGMAEIAAVLLSQGYFDHKTPAQQIQPGTEKAEKDYGIIDGTIFATVYVRDSKTGEVQIFTFQNKPQKKEVEKELDDDPVLNNETMLDDDWDDEYILSNNPASASLTAQLNRGSTSELKTATSFQLLKQIFNSKTEAEPKNSQKNIFGNNFNLASVFGFEPQTRSLDQNPENNFTELFSFSIPKKFADSKPAEPAKHILFAPIKISTPDTNNPETQANFADGSHTSLESNHFLQDSKVSTTKTLKADQSSTIRTETNLKPTSGVPVASQPNIAKEAFFLNLAATEMGGSDSLLENSSSKTLTEKPQTVTPAQPAEKPPAKPPLGKESRQTFIWIDPKTALKETVSKPKPAEDLILESKKPESQKHRDQNENDPVPIPTAAIAQPTATREPPMPTANVYSEARIKVRPTLKPALNATQPLLKMEAQIKELAEVKAQAGHLEQEGRLARTEPQKTGLYIFQKAERTKEVIQKVRPFTAKVEKPPGILKYAQPETVKAEIERLNAKQAAKQEREIKLQPVELFKRQAPTLKPVLGTKPVRPLNKEAGFKKMETKAWESATKTEPLIRTKPAIKIRSWLPERLKKPNNEISPVSALKPRGKEAFKPVETKTHNLADFQTMPALKVYTTKAAEKITRSRAVESLKQNPRTISPSPKPALKISSIRVIGAKSGPTVQPAENLGWYSLNLFETRFRPRAEEQISRPTQRSVINQKRQSPFEALTKGKGISLKSGLNARSDDTQAALTREEALTTAA